MMGNSSLRVLAVFAAVVCIDGWSMTQLVSAAGDGGGGSSAAHVTSKEVQSDHSASDAPQWEKDTPVRPLPKEPLGIDRKLSEPPDPPTPERVRLGRWLFFDNRL